MKKTSNFHPNDLNAGKLQKLLATDTRYQKKLVEKLLDISDTITQHIS